MGTLRHGVDFLLHPEIEADYSSRGGLIGAESISGRCFVTLKNHGRIHTIKKQPYIFH